MRKFSDLELPERQEWIARYQQWLVDFAIIENNPQKTKDLSAVFNNGLELISAFQYCRNFVSETKRAKDYRRRINLMRRFVNRINADLQKLGSSFFDPTSKEFLTSHVGRPTRAESAARAAAKKIEQLSSPALFEDLETTYPPIATPLSSSRCPSIAEIRWLLSPDLQQLSDSIRNLRSEYEEACTRAKQMAEDGRPADDIAQFAQKAANGVEKVEQIYARIDSELQLVYVRLKEDSNFIAKMSTKSKLNAKELRTYLRPYWDKLSLEEKESFKRQAISLIDSESPSVAAKRKEDKERKSKADNIIKYLRRTDKPNSLKRVIGMERRLQELRELIGDKADKYIPLYQAALEDYEKNIKPLDVEKTQFSKIQRN